MLLNLKGGLKMTASPVLQQIVPILQARFEHAKEKGRIGKNTKFRLCSESVNGTGKRRYFCLGQNGQELKGVPSIEATPTISD